MNNTHETAQMLAERRALIQNKEWLRRIYVEVYTTFRNAKRPEGPVVELGSGAGFIKEIIPEVTTSDVIAGDGIDQVFSATHMPLANHSIASFFLFDVLHHIKQPRTALKEMQRCLKPKGTIIMIEPYNSWWGRFIYQHFHNEVFDPNAGWETPGTDPLYDANGAIPWIIFVRDQLKFKSTFPQLSVVSIIPHTPFSYLVSGGLSNPQLLPTFFYPFITRIEQMLLPWNHIFGMFATITLRKNIRS